MFSLKPVLIGAAIRTTFFFVEMLCESRDFFMSGCDAVLCVNRGRVFFHRQMYRLNTTARMYVVRDFFIQGICISFD